MSISNRHSVIPFVAGKSEPMAEQRLARVGYKTTKNKPALYPSVCASLPVIPSEDIVSNVNALIPIVRATLEGLQDSIFRNAYETSKGQLASIGNEEISVEQCIEFYNAAAVESGRLSSAGIEAWFDSDLMGNLTVAIAERLHLDPEKPEEALKVAQHVSGYRGMFVDIAKHDTFYNTVQCEQLKRALTFTDDMESNVATKIGAKLDAMLKPKVAIAELVEF